MEEPCVPTRAASRPLVLVRGWLIGCLLAGAAVARAEPATVVYVPDFTGVSEGVAAVWTESLCRALSADSGLEVMCAPDVRRMAEHWAQLEALGGAGKGWLKLEERLSAVRYVVEGELVTTETSERVVKLTVSDKHPQSRGWNIAPGAHIVATEQRLPSAVHVLEHEGMARWVSALRADWRSLRAPLQTESIPEKPLTSEQPPPTLEPK